MTNTCLIRVFNLDEIFKSRKVFKIIPLLIAGAAGLAAGILAAKMFGKKDDEDERQWQQEKEAQEARYKKFEQRKRSLEEFIKKLVVLVCFIIPTEY